MMLSFIYKTKQFKQLCDVSLGKNVKVLCRSVAGETAVNKPKDALKEQIVGYRHVYPEFLPDPKIEFRNSLREKLERADMVARRTQIDIPEFYVGSILAVTSSDPHTPGKTHRFVGICIKREGCGLRATFILRNIIDHQGIEIMYEMYDPTLHKVEVLKLEKRLDDELLYLRDALPEYCTFDVNMDPEILPEGAAVPINQTKVKLKPRPWLERWERKDLKGVQDLGLPEKFYKRAKELEKPWEKYDLMKEYMRTIPEEEQLQIYSEVQSELHKLESQRKKLKRKRVFVKPSKLA
ncbi:39S ribosomal protein L19, mitochondrial [Anthonomus grandis grandis]|uniref:39S ribosomal protein L19, mitochondrial n=1 Tax=Anthonomus grandis grandis TaxID=2921223 RepID=UPI0021655657|nr:39S ribosomal protein L19, mitochondrial [Anthonomus grandis grandis]